jgi:hypothetical protein
MLSNVCFLPLMPTRRFKRARVEFLFRSITSNLGNASHCVMVVNALVQTRMVFIFLLVYSRGILVVFLFFLVYIK